MCGHFPFTPQEIWKSESERKWVPAVLQSSYVHEEGQCCAWRVPIAKAKSLWPVMSGHTYSGCEYS